MERMIRLVEIGLTICKNLVLIIAAFVGITIAIAANNFASDNIVWGIINSEFGAGGTTAGGRQTTINIINHFHGGVIAQREIEGILDKKLYRDLRSVGS